MPRRELPTESLSLHEEAARVPEMPTDQYKVFLADVKKNGVLEDIELIPGTRTIIEGRTRWKAARDAGLSAVPVKDAELHGETPVMYMLRKALYRRHLTPGQRAHLGNEITKQLKTEARQRQREGAAKGGSKTKVPGKSPEASSPSPPAPAPAKKNRGGEVREQAAQIAGTNSKYISQAAKIEQKAPEVYAQLGAGSVSLPEASRALKAKENAAKPSLGGSYLNLIPNFPLEAVAPLADVGVFTVEDLDARAAELRKQKGQANATRYTALRATGLDPQLVLKVGDALVGHFAPQSPKSEPKPAAVDSLTPHIAAACPFCGSAKIEHRVLTGGMRCIACQECNARGPEAAESSVARSLWNKRAKK